MPNLPKPRFGRSARARGEVVAPPEPQAPNVEIVEGAGLRWINIERPRAVDRAWLEEHFDFHPLDYEDVFSRNQRPKVDEYDDYLFIVLHFPRFDKTVGRLNAAELDLFVGPDFLITLPNEPLAAGRVPLRALPHQRGAPRAALLQGRRATCSTRSSTTASTPSFPMLRKMGNKLERLEEEIFEGRSEEVVRDISNVKQEIINFRKIVRPQRAALRDLERTKQRYIAEDLDIYFDDIIDASERVWDMLENYKEVVEALESTNESVISHRVNDILRVLTVVQRRRSCPLTLDREHLGHERAASRGEAATRPRSGSSSPRWSPLLGGMLVLLPPPALALSRRGVTAGATRGRRAAPALRSPRSNGSATPSRWTPARRRSACWSSSTRTRRRCRTA